MQLVKKTELRRRLDAFPGLQPLPGLQSRKSRERFVRHLMRSLAKLRVQRGRHFKGSTDPSERDFHPLRAIVEYFEGGNRDKAIWLAFLTIHYGQDVPQSVRLFYGKLGRGRWDWETLRQNPDAIRNWMRQNRSLLKWLKFGNHRKRRINNPDHKRGTPAVIRSFVEWVNRFGDGSPFRAFASVIDGAKNEVEAFDGVYDTLKVLDFGRTAKFDFLCLLGNLGILPVSPGHCYLDGATGPKLGALLLVTGKKQGGLSAEVEKNVRELQRQLGLPVECIEDALCNWQKKPKGKKGAQPEKGFLSVCC